jgi:hypothetical protein
MAGRPYSGRLVFDHLAKTGGQAVNAWLTAALGTGCVTPPVYGEHRSMIRHYGGAYSVIAGHLSFNEGDTLDPRYDYVTLLREPVDRIVSWIFYLLHDVTETALTRGLVVGARRFLDSEGDDATPDFVTSISNLATEHFRHATGRTGLQGSAMLDAALEALGHYRVVGVYERMPEFTSQLAALIGIPPPPELPRVNVTSRRPDVAGVSATLRRRIGELNALDLVLYDTVRNGFLASDRPAATSVTAPAGASAGAPALGVPTRYDWPPARDRDHPQVFIALASMPPDHRAEAGQRIEFAIDLTLMRTVHHLIVGIHVFDLFGNWAFGTNSELLGQAADMAAGRYRVVFSIAADLPIGGYTAGFAADERTEDGVTPLVWYDRLGTFEVAPRPSEPFAGYSYLSPRLRIEAVA